MKLPHLASISRQTSGYLALLLLASGFAGCAWVEKWKGDIPKDWSKTGGSMRGNNPDAKPSGLFMDRRSEQIEKNLGGDY